MRRWWREQRGSQTLELAALLPILVLTALVIWQVTLAAYTVVVAEAAARDAARAAAVGNDPVNAARRAVTGLSVRVQCIPDDCSGRDNGFGPEVTVSVTVIAPTVAPFLRQWPIPITRQVTMPASRR
jgi:hypothetical protein